MSYDNETEKQTIKRWEGYAAGLVGRKVVRVGYMNDTEMDVCGWDRRALVIELEGGVLMWASQDDEGNDAGSMFMQGYKVDGKELDQFPVI